MGANGTQSWPLHALQCTVICYIRHSSGPSSAGARNGVGPGGPRWAPVPFSLLHEAAMIYTCMEMDGPTSAPWCSGNHPSYLAGVQPLLAPSVVSSTLVTTRGPAAWGRGAVWGRAAQRARQNETRAPKSSKVPLLNLNYGHICGRRDTKCGNIQQNIKWQTRQVFRYKRQGS